MSKPGKRTLAAREHVDRLKQYSLSEAIELVKENRITSYNVCYTKLLRM